MSEVADDETLGALGRVEAYDRGVDGPDRYTIVFPDLARRSASPACELIEVLAVGRPGGESSADATWTVAAHGERPGERIRFDHLPESVQQQVRDALDRQTPS
ncbi:MAG: hypothetical protein KF809_12090 [Chloroflexi bacterium]|nr:hypothetical protein [Chloroflexota bacterium]